MASFPTMKTRPEKSAETPVIQVVISTEVLLVTLKQVTNARSGPVKLQTNTREHLKTMLVMVLVITPTVVILMGKLHHGATMEKVHLPGGKYVMFLSAENVHGRKQRVHKDLRKQMLSIIVKLTKAALE